MVDGVGSLFQGFKQSKPGALPPITGHHYAPSQAPGQLNASQLSNTKRVLQLALGPLHGKPN